MARVQQVKRARHDGHASPRRALALGCAVFLSLAEFNSSVSYTVPAMNAAALALAGGAWWMGWLSV